MQARGLLFQFETDHEENSSADKRRFHYKNLKDLGDCHSAMGDSKRARMSYEKAAAAAPGEPGPHVALGALEVREGNLEKARQCYQKAISLDANCAEAYGGLAVVCHQLGQHQQAFGAYMKCLELDSDNLVALLGLFQTSVQMGTFSQITRYLEIYLASHADDTAVLFCLSTLYARDGHFAQAREAVLRVVAHEPENAEAMTLLKQIEQKLSGQPSSDHAAKPKS